MSYIEFNDLIGKTITSITRDDSGSHGDSLTFDMSDGSQYVMYHEQDCCEHVSIEDIDAPLDRIIGSPITMFEESFSTKDGNEERYDSETWTFYRIVTEKDGLSIRWYGTSNGYYSESASVICTKDPSVHTDYSFFH